MSTKFFSRLGTLCLAYFVAWTIGYLLINFDDFRLVEWSEYGEYFLLFWSGSGFVRPVYTGITSLVLFIPISFLLFWVQRRLKK